MLNSAPGAAEAAKTSLPEPLPLYQCQEEAIKFLSSRPRAMLAMAMGLGKTRCAVARMAELGARHNLVLAPLCAIDDVWETEIGQYWPEPQPHVINLGSGTRDHGGRGPGQEAERRTHRSAKDKGRYGAMRLKRARRGEQTVTLLNYESLLRPELAEWASSIPWDLAVLDESHRLKAPGGKLNREVRGLLQETPVRVALTGTPMPQGPLDIFGQFLALDPSVFGESYARFRNRYEGKGKGRDRYRNLDQLMLKFRDLAYETSSIDELRLPGKVKSVRKITLSPTAKRAHDQLARRLAARLESGERITAASLLAALTRMRQVTSGYAAIDHDGPEPGLLPWKEQPRSRLVRVDWAKQQHLEELLTEPDSQERAVVFALFRHDLEDIAAAAAGAGRVCYEYSGARKELERWKEEPGAVLAAQLQAGSISVSMAEARYCIYYSIGYSIADHMQSMARIRRAGQERTQIYYYLCGRDTIDVRTLRSLESGEDMVKKILERREIQIPLL